MSVAWVAVGASVVNGVMSSQAAGDAADAQAAGAAASDATQRYQYDTTRADNAPFLANGTAASNRLSYLMGLSPNSAGGAAGAASGPAPTRESLRAQLLGQYTTAGPMQGLIGNSQNDTQWQPVTNTGYILGHPETLGTSAPAGQSGGVNEEALNAEIERRMAEYSQQQAAQTTAANNDPAYGSLSRKFTMADRDADPVYQSGLQFGLDQGTQGINRLAAAKGNFLSGATLKALTRFGNDYGSTKAGDSYNRFNNDNTQQYNRLAGIAGSGQTASSQVGASGMNMANNISASQQGVGNARASGYLTQSNALQNGINGGVSAWKNMQPTNTLSQAYNPSGYSSTGGDTYYGMGQNWGV